MTEAVPLTGLTVTTPWYPTLHNPVGGSFVTDWTGLARSFTEDLRVVHAEEWPGGTPEVVARLERPADAVLTRMASRRELDIRGRWSTITRVPTIITSGFDVADRAEAAVESTRAYGRALDTPVVHGHVGYLGGLTAARLADPAARVVVTEHSTGLGDFLSTDRGRELYTEVLERAHRLTCVSSVVRDLILTHCPGFDDTVVVVPNPVDFEPPHQRADRPATLDRWVYAGGLIERKGVVRLLEAFTRFAAGRPAATLDLYGVGPLQGQLAEIAQAAGLEQRVQFRGNVTHDQLLAALPQHDVLLAPSRYETFHLVVPEAVAAGLPVVVTRSGGPQEALAGVEDLVGRFVDVNDDADELMEAVLDLEGGLEAIDVPRARRTLAARYGHDAIRSTLADLYGCTDRRLDTAMPPVATAPVEHVVLAVSGWRRYAVNADLASLAEAGAPATLLTTDPALLAAHEDVPHDSPARFVKETAKALDVDPGSVAVGPRTHTLQAARAGVGLVRGAVRDARTSPDTGMAAVLSTVPQAARRLAGGLRRDGRSLAAAVKARRQVPKQSGDPTSSSEAVHVVSDVASFPLVASFLDLRPDIRLALEVDRRRLGLTPVDAP
jgi:glycogen(starch) synthase